MGLNQPMRFDCPGVLLYKLCAHKKVRLEEVNLPQQIHACSGFRQEALDCQFLAFIY